MIIFTHIVDPNRPAPIWLELAAANRDDFCPTLEDACRATVQRLRLALPVITHEVDDMVREVF